MLSTTPQASASSPGPTSSQSSSSGSCYSSSLTSSTRDAPSSGTSSGQTSPPSAITDRHIHRFSPIHKQLYHSSGEPTAIYHSSAMAQQQHQHQQQPQQQQQRQQQPHQSQQQQHYPFSYGSQSHLAHNSQQSFTPVSQHTLAGISNSAMSRAVPRYEGHGLSGWGSASDQPPRQEETAMAVDSASTHAGKIHNYATSPDASRGPLAKARRTSPGGSRASGDLYPTQPGYDGKTPGSAGLTGIGAPPDGAPSVAASRRGSHEAGGHGALAATTHGHTHHPSRVSPRSRIPGDHGKSPNATSLVAGPPSSSSAGIASDSTGMRVEAVSPRLKPAPQLPKMNLATFPPQELLKVLATLLHEIATANDEFRPEGGKGESGRRKKSSRSKDKEQGQGAAGSDGGDADPTAAARVQTPQASHLSFNDSRRPSVTTAALGALATPSSTLCFHARNVPSISIESYLLRILKYCPTTNEVFLSLLVYFDRMSRMGTGAKPGANGDGEVAGEAAGLPRATEMANFAGMSASSGSLKETGTSDTHEFGQSQVAPFAHPGIRGFAIDSYNVHRLVIAGVTVASKFFSDVFYTNSRYAKVGGLPVHELNQLELQFLLLNDFRLTIPLEEMQRYADQLLMYGSGRPENVSRVKEIGQAQPHAPSSATGTGVPASAGDSNAPTQGASATYPDEPGSGQATSSGDQASAFGTGTGTGTGTGMGTESKGERYMRTGHEGQEDVGMSDA